MKQDIASDISPDRNTGGRRKVYRHEDLNRLLSPRTIAIIGASPNPTSFGHRTLDGLANFEGEIFCVNAKYDEVAGYRCFASLGDIPAPVDCAVITTGAAHVEPIVRDCIKAGVGGGVIYASGYSETGAPEDVAAQARLAALVAGASFRVVGPNCLGLINLKSNMALTFMGDIGLPRPEGPGIGIVSQSGALGIGLAQAAKMGVQISHAFTSGNSCDVDIADLVSYLADAPDCKAIAAVFEGMADPGRILQAGGIARAANKPLVIYKLATGEGGAAAAMSHTGSLAGSSTLYSALFRAAGIIEVDTLEALLETADFLAVAKAGHADGVAVLASSGGMAIMASDKAEAHGVALPPLGPAAQSVLSASIPAFGSATNPCDVTAQVLNAPNTLEECAEALFLDPAFGTVVLPLHYSYEATSGRIQLLNRLAARHKKTACVVWASSWLEGTGSSCGEKAPHVAMFRSMDRCFAAIAKWNASQHLKSGQQDATSFVDQGRKACALELLGADTSPGVDEFTAKKILRLYDIPVVPEAIARDPDQLAEICAQIGYPVALKVVSPDILHKTEADSIALDVADETSARQLYKDLVDRARNAMPTARIEGVLVQQMVQQGVEIVVGGRVDPMFGPVVLTGLGGIFVELLKDSVTRLAPLNVEQAADMLTELRGSALLDGFRGSAPVNRTLLASVISNVSALLVDLKDHVAELDINPLICNGDDIVAVDALIIRRQAVP